MGKIIFWKSLEQKLNGSRPDTNTTVRMTFSQAAKRSGLESPLAD